MRGLLLVFVAVLFFAAVLSSLFVFTVASSLKYDNVKTELKPLITNFVQQQSGLTTTIDNALSLMRTHCNTSSEYVLSYQNYTIVFPCSVILEGRNSIIDYGSGEIIKQTYYKDYNCKFFDCFNTAGGIPLFLVSESTRVFLITKFYFLFAASIALFVLMFILLEKRSNLGILSGTLILAALIPLKLLSNLLPKLFGDFSGIARIFFSTANYVFIRGIFIGGILLLLGIFFRMFGIGLKISNLIEKLKGPKIITKIIERPVQKAKSKGK